MKAKNIYYVSVSNIGNIGPYTKKAEALKVFRTYVEQSESRVGRAGGEDVVLWKNDEPIKEHNGAFFEETQWLPACYPNHESDWAYKNK